MSSILFRDIFGSGLVLHELKHSNTFRELECSVCKGSVEFVSNSKPELSGAEFIFGTWLD